MAKYSKTDDKAFTSLRLKNTNYSSEIAKMKAEEARNLKELAKLAKAVKSDTVKIAKATAKVEDEIRFSGAPEFLESRREANAI